MWSDRVGRENGLLYSVCVYCVHAVLAFQEDSANPFSSDQPRKQCPPTPIKTPPSRRKRAISQSMESQSPEISQNCSFESISFGFTICFPFSVFLFSFFQFIMYQEWGGGIGLRKRKFWKESINWNPNDLSQRTKECFILNVVVKMGLRLPFEFDFSL